jgi:hypothetical protein
MSYSERRRNLWNFDRCWKTEDAARLARLVGASVIDSLAKNMSVSFLLPATLVIVVVVNISNF